MTTNIQLEELAKKLNLNDFRGVFMADELKDMKPRENESAVVNTEDSRKNGKHWIAWYKNGDDKYFFDSYGSHIIPELKSYLGSPINCHNFQIQKFNDDICGELSILFIYLMSRNIPYEDVILSMI